jgi:TPP-dependent pyruvate/acetoin dehydrogenase alpha subunit
MTEVIVPAGGMAGTEALLLVWLKAEGDTVEAGEILAEVETDKATMEIESPTTGTVTRLLYAAGSTVPLGQPIAEIGSAADRDGATATVARPALQHPDGVRVRRVPAVAPPRAKTSKGRKKKDRESPLERLRDPQAGAGPIDLEGTPREALAEWLEAMVVIREFEEACEPISRAGKIPGGMHSSAGQEAVAVGPTRALREHDIVVSSHRSHHTSLAKGISPREVMAELYGKESGCVGGRGGHMHLASFEIGLWGSNGIVGGGLGLATGVALAAKLRELDQVCLAYFGDGGANTGRVWEAINLASIWKLPLVAVCENNLYAVETFVGQSTAAESIAGRASGFGLPAIQVDGQDVCAMYRAVATARERAADGDGPTFIEALTFRYRGHNTGDAQRYRTKDEVDAWRTSRDPIARLRGAMTDAGMLDTPSYEAIVERARAAAADSIAYAEAAPWPDPATALDDVFGPEIRS